MDFDRYSAGKISSRDAQSVGDSIKRCCVDGYLADSAISILITAPPIVSSDVIDPVLQIASADTRMGAPIA
jgi:hypothetical protein